MATLGPLAPNLDGTIDTASILKVGGDGTTYWSCIAEDPATGQPDADYVYNSGTSSGSSFFEFTEVPADFGTMDTLDVETYTAVSGRVDDNISFYVQIFQNDEVTTLTNESLIGGAANPNGLITTTLTLNANGLAAGKAVWDLARLRVRWAYAQNMSKDSYDLRLHAFELNGTYTQTAVIVALDGSANSGNDATADITVTAGLAGDADVAAQVSGNLTADFSLIGSADSASDGVGDLLRPPSHFHDFETGSDTANITVANSDGAGVDAFYSVVRDGLATAKYHAGYVHSGSLSGRFTDGNAGLGASYAVWRYEQSTTNKFVGYLYLESRGSGTHTIGLLRTFLDTSAASGVRLNADRTLSVLSAASSSSGATAVPLAQWVRIELDTVHGANGSATLRLYLSPASGTPDETVTLSNVDMRAASDRVRIGMLNGADTNANAGIKFAWDDIELRAFAFLDGSSDAASGSTAAITVPLGSMGAVSPVASDASGSVGVTATLTAAGSDASGASGSLDVVSPLDAVAANAVQASATLSAAVSFVAVSASASDAVAATVGASPQNLVATAVSPSRIDLTWDAVSGALGYDIERDGAVLLRDHGTNSYSDTGLNEATEHTYRVRAVVG